MYYYEYKNKSCDIEKKVNKKILKSMFKVRAAKILNDMFSHLLL